MGKNHNSRTSDLTSSAMNYLLVRKNIGLSIDGRERKNSPRFNEAPSCDSERHHLCISCLLEIQRNWAKNFMFVKQLEL